jgi:exodeoxyribonuclease-3
MKLATWNVNSLVARMPRVLELLERHRPDVLFMQETKCEPGAFPLLELEAAGYRAVHHSTGRWAGVALLARGEPAEVCFGLAGEPTRDEGRWLEADVDGLRAVSVYVPNGRAPDSPFYEDKLRFLEAMAQRVAELSRGPLVLAGDFNVCPTDLDVYDPGAFVGATHVTAPERERFRALLDAGTVDAFRELHLHDPGFTWWDYRQGHFQRDMGLRIDAFLLSQPLAGDLVECGIDRDFRKGSRPSDHAPLLCELGARGARPPLRRSA